MHNTNYKWGYWAGAAFCVLSLTALVLGLLPIATAAREKIKIVSIPGETQLEFKIPGPYIGVYLSEAKQDIENRLRELEYSLIANDENELLDIEKIPHAAYASQGSVSDKEQKQVPLFQFSIPSAGSYTLLSHYPYEMDGPQTQALIFAMDFSYTRREVIVGLIVFLIFAVLGIYTLRKTYKLRRPSRN